MVYETFLLGGIHMEIWCDKTGEAPKTLMGENYWIKSHAIGINQLTTDPFMITDPPLSPVVFPNDTLKETENTKF